MTVLLFLLLRKITCILKIKTMELRRGGYESTLKVIVLVKIPSQLFFLTLLPNEDKV